MPPNWVEYEFKWDVLEFIAVVSNWVIISFFTPSMSIFFVWCVFIGGMLIISVENVWEHKIMDRENCTSFGPIHSPSWGLRLLFWAGPQGSGHSLHHIFPSAPNYNIHLYGYAIMEKVHRDEQRGKYTGLFQILYSYFLPENKLCTVW